MGVFANARKKTHNYLVISGIVRTFAMSKRREKAKAQLASFMAICHWYFIICRVDVLWNKNIKKRIKEIEDMVAIAFMATVTILVALYYIWDDYSSKKRFSE